MTRDEANVNPDDELRDGDPRDVDDARPEQEPAAHDETSDGALGDSAAKPIDMSPAHSPETVETPVNEPASAAPTPSSAASASSPAPLDASTVEPAQGVAPPMPEVVAWVGGRVDPSYCELLELVHGMREPLQADDADSIFEPPPNVPHGATPVGGAVPPFGGRQSSHSGPTVQVQVEVRVSRAGMEQISHAALRKYARAAHDEIMIVARELYEFIQEVRTLEAERRMIWDRW